MADKILTLSNLMDTAVGGGPTPVSLGVSVYNDNTVPTGTYYVERNTSVDFTINEVYVEIIEGVSGDSVTASLEVNDLVVFGPVVVNYGTPNNTSGLSIAVAEGSTVNWTFTTISADTHEVYAVAHGETD